MNANQLADELDDIDAYEKHQILLGKASDMLRQQQFEIEALKKYKDDMHTIDKKLFESIQKSNEMWDKAANSILRKAQE